MVSKAKSADMKIKKKRWISIVSPMFNDQTIGDTNVFDIKNALGKNLKVNLMTLIGDPRKQNIDILFRTEKLKGDTAVIAEAKGYNVQHPALKKLVRRGKTKIQDSFKCYTGDKKPVVVKSFMLTRFVVNKSVASKIRAHVKQLTVNKVAKTNFEDFVKSVIQNSFQREMKDAMSKIYPLRVMEFNTVKIITPTKKTKFETPAKVEAVEASPAPSKEENKPEPKAETEKKEPVAEEKKEIVEEKKSEEVVEEVSEEKKEE